MVEMSRLTKREYKAFQQQVFVWSLRKHLFNLLNNFDLLLKSFEHHTYHITIPPCCSLIRKKLLNKGALTYIWIIQEMPLYGPSGYFQIKEKSMSRNAYFYLPFKLTIKPNISYNNNSVSQDFRRFPKCQWSKALMYGVNMARWETIIMLKQKTLGPEHRGCPGSTISYLCGLPQVI